MTAGRIFGVELRIHWTFFLLPLFVWYTEYSAHGTANEGRDLALVGIIFASVVAHELGHALVARRSGLRAKSIILLPIGGITQLDDSQPIGPGSRRPIIGPGASGLRGIESQIGQGMPWSATFVSPWRGR